MSRLAYYRLRATDIGAAGLAAPSNSFESFHDREAARGFVGIGLIAPRDRPNVHELIAHPSPALPPRCLEDRSTADSSRGTRLLQADLEVDDIASAMRSRSVLRQRDDFSKAIPLVSTIMGTAPSPYPALTS